MKKLLTLTTLLLTVVAGAADAPFIPEVDARFKKIENMTGDVTFNKNTGVSSLVDFATSGDGVYPLMTAVLEINYASIAAATNAVVSWNIPGNAIITNCFYEVTETFTSSSDAATIGFQVEGANDIVAAAAISSGTTWDATGKPVQGVPDWATVADQVKMSGTAKDLVVVRGGGEVLTAGNVILYCQYVQGE